MAVIKAFLIAFCIQLTYTLNPNTWHDFPSVGRSYLYHNGCFDWNNAQDAINVCVNDGAEHVAALSTQEIWNYVTGTLITSAPVTGTGGCSSWWDQTYIVIGTDNCGGPWENGDAYDSSFFNWHSGEPDAGCGAQPAMIIGFPDDLLQNNHGDTYGGYFAVVCEKQMPIVTTQPTTSAPTTFAPTANPSKNPSETPTTNPTTDPTTDPSIDPTTDPSTEPTTEPTLEPTTMPTTQPTYDPTSDPTRDPTYTPSASPSNIPTQSPSGRPTENPIPATTNSEKEGGVNDDISTTKIVGGKKENDKSSFLDDFLYFLIFLIGGLLCCICVLLVLIYAYNKKQKNKRKRQQNIDKKFAEYNNNVAVELVRVQSMSDADIISTEQTQTHIQSAEPDVYSDSNALSMWLDGMGLIEYYDLFIEQGFGEQMTTLSAVTDEDLAMIGIDKMAHRKRILLQISNNNHIMAMNMNMSDGPSNMYINNGFINTNNTQQPNHTNVTGLHRPSDLEDDLHLPSEVNSDELYQRGNAPVTTAGHYTATSGANVTDNVDDEHTQETEETEETEGTSTDDEDDPGNEMYNKGYGVTKN